ncbi:MAG: radical SAM protein [Pseudomonadota bacterium]
MRILLINPPASVYNSPPVVPLGLAYIGAVLKNDGHAVEVVDLSLHPNSKWEASLERADLIGVTANTLTYRGAAEVLRLAKRIKPDVVTVIGGPHVTCMPEQTLRHIACDYGVLGEGEETVRDLCRVLENGGEISGVRGIVWRDRVSGAVGKTEERPLIKNLDGIPFPALDLFPPLASYSTYNLPHNVNTPTGVIMTSRGCPYHCVFCYKATFGRIWRTRSPENIVDEWERLIRVHKAEQISILDDSFNTDPKRVIRICDLIIERGLVVPWQTPNGIHAAHVTEEMLTRMKEAGCVRVSFGVESGNPHILSTIGKQVTLEGISRAFQLCRKVGIETCAFFIMGLPGENETTMQDTIRFARKLDPDAIAVYIANPLPGTKFREIVEREGTFLHKEDEFSGHYDSSPNFTLGEITPELLLKMRRRAYLRFYLRPRYLARQILTARFFRRLPGYFDGLKRIWHYSKR